ncbi:KTSC domain-containing protein [Mucilaginibacter limnophilus]|uniref:KTSC domain-containing protein n=1 Tax=Mucilaginibacter limnophilus TaxID=1932778 RepID=A0A3S2UZD7_9SPHI|nr:KTSC domain-containing protein [Mucilaginibacter limnophilus]RVT96463.1 KTSC domain-containing protein [Mucilaginibacter limnophilus]
MPSTVISKVTYNSNTRILRVDYVSGQAYLYKEVPESVYKELKASLVKGRYLTHFIKGRYAFEKLIDG